MGFLYICYIYILIFVLSKNSFNNKKIVLIFLLNLLYKVYQISSVVFELLQTLDMLDSDLINFLVMDCLYPFTFDDLLNGLNIEFAQNYLNLPKQKKTYIPYYGCDWTACLNYTTIYNSILGYCVDWILIKKNNSVLLFVHTCFYYYSLYLWYSILFIFFYKLYIVDVLKTNNISFPEYFYFEYEQNIGDGECLYMLLSFCLAILLLNLVYLFSDTKFLHQNILFFLVVLVLFVVPVRLVVSFGSSFIQYLKGSATQSQLTTNAFSDSIAMFAFFSRFSIQSVRIALIYGLYFAIHEYIFIMPKNYISSWLTDDFLMFYSWFYYNLFVLRWVIELVDSTVSICNQLASFFFVIFWLFSYINTCERKKKQLFWFTKIKIRIIIDRRE